MEDSMITSYDSLYLRKIRKYFLYSYNIQIITFIGICICSRKLVMGKNWRNFKRDQICLHFDNSYAKLKPIKLSSFKLACIQFLFFFYFQDFFLTPILSRKFVRCTSLLFLLFDPKLSHPNYRFFWKKKLYNTNI